MLNPHLSRRPVSRVARLVTLGALLSVAVPIALFAQNTFATLSGVISDQSGAVTPGVVVTASDRDRQVKHEARTDGTGRFEIVGLPQGNYSLQASLPGFETFNQQMTLSGEDVHHDITLAVGTLQETVSVGSGGPTDVRPFSSKPVVPRPANCGAAAGTRPAGAVRVGGQIRQPWKIRSVAPIYPEGSAPGVVKMEALIGIDGLVQETKVANDAAPALAQAAVDAVRQWEFEPTLLNCVAVPVRMTVTVQFG